MEAITLETPTSIGACLGWDPGMSEHDRKRVLAKKLISTRLGVEEKSIVIEREAPRQFGFHTQLFARVGGHDLSLLIRTASFRSATVCAVAEPGAVLGLDLRDMHPDDGTIADIKRGSRLFETTDVSSLLRHWTRVQAVREADGRGARIKPIYVRLDSTLTVGWLPDRPARYVLSDLSTDGWVITLAHLQV